MNFKTQAAETLYVTMNVLAVLSILVGLICAAIFPVTCAVFFLIATVLLILNKINIDKNRIE